MYRLLFLVVLLIVHGSLYPWQFHAGPPPTSAPLILLHSWAAPPVNRYFLRDVAVNLLLYLPLGVFGFLALRRHAQRGRAGAGTLLLAALLSTAMEMAQIYVPQRTCSLFDVLLNVLGAVIGLAIAVRLDDRLVTIAGPHTPRLATTARGPILLLGCWICCQLFPFFPDLSRTHLAEKLLLLASVGSLSLLLTFVRFTEWLVVGRLIEPATRPDTSVSTFLTLLVLVPAKVLIAGRTMTGAELVGAVVAFLVWRRLRAAEPARTYWMAWLLAVAVLLDGLMPFRWDDPATAFHWVPFEGVLASDWQSGFAILLRKAFVYGAAIWLFRRSGWRFGSAMVLIALALAGIEVVQLHLVGRTPEITDPLLALLMTFVLAVLERREGAKHPS